MWNCITVSALESLLQTSKINTLPGQQTLRNCPSNSMTVYVIGTLAVAAVCASCQAVLLCCYPPAHRDRQTLHCFQVPIQRAGRTRPWWTTKAIPQNISLAKALPLVRRRLRPRPCARCIPTGSLSAMNPPRWTSTTCKSRRTTCTCAWAKALWRRTCSCACTPRVRAILQSMSCSAKSFFFFLVVVVVVHSKFLLLLLVTHIKPLAQSIQLSPYIGNQNVFFSFTDFLCFVALCQCFRWCFLLSQWKSILVSYHFQVLWPMMAGGAEPALGLLPAHDAVRVAPPSLP